MNDSRALFLGARHCGQMLQCFLPLMRRHLARPKPSPTTLNYVEALRSEREAAKRNVRLEPEPETTGAATILKIGLSHRPV
jgi:hypothetical protein